MTGRLDDDQIRRLLDDHCSRCKGSGVEPGPPRFPMPRAPGDHHAVVEQSCSWCSGTGQSTAMRNLAPDLARECLERGAELEAAAAQTLHDLAEALIHEGQHREREAVMEAVIGRLCNGWVTCEIDGVVKWVRYVSDTNEPLSPAEAALMSRLDQPEGPW